MPDTPFIVRVPEALKREIRRVARENDRTLSQEVRRALAREFAPCPSIAEWCKPPAAEAQR